MSVNVCVTLLFSQMTITLDKHLTRQLLDGNN